MAALIKQARKCSVCGKILRAQRKSNLCRLHYQLDLQLKKRRKWKKEHRCIQCGKKVEPIIIYPAGDRIPPVTTIPVRCYECRQLQKSHRGKVKEKKQNIESINNKTEVVTTT